jgi:UDP-glucose 4-epimerase
MQPEIRGRDVLVTGGAGFVGSHLVDALVPANDVRVLDDLSSGREERLPDGVEFVRGDVRRPEVLRRAVDGVDVVFHTAALVDVSASVESPVETDEINSSAALRVLECARRTDARVVLSSSAAVYGPPESVPVPESAPKTPTSPYGVQKLSADRYARLFHDLYGLETVALRYFNAYGPRQTGDYAGVVSTFLEQARRGDPLTVHGDGEQTRDFVHVSDVVRANLRAAATDAVGEAYNVGTGRSISIADLAALVRRLADSESDIVRTEGRRGDIRHSEADISKASTRLDYEPTVPLEQGLADLA